MNQEPPHIFAIAEAAYTSVRLKKQNQGVIISGESGAGKSESTKLILQYLTSCASTESKESNWILQQILEANTILESFGNAKTSRNNNSSRFGKFIQIQFNQKFHIIGANIVNYLLEKSRVAFQAEGERNYHVFYELVQGCSVNERDKYQIEDIGVYDYLNQSGCFRIEGVDDSKSFEGLKLALTVLKMTAQDLEAVLRMLSAILWMGNIKFVSNSGQESVIVQNTDVVDRIASLLDIDGRRLKESLVFRRMTLRGETTMIPIKPDQATDNRNSIAKALYDNLFQRIVDFINKSMTTTVKMQNFIGVLDIFGFEDFESNSFEQFCINYTNEKLQQFFNQYIFKLEQEEYDKESIKWEKIKFTDNQVCIDLIEAKPTGIISLLDEETKFPKGTDESWLQKLEQNFSKHLHYIKPKTLKGVFGIKHYAGEVIYDVTGFLEKNKDSISEDLIDIIKKSKISWISNTFTPKTELASTVTREKSIKGSKPQGAIGGKATAATYFKNQLLSLVNTLGSTDPHYVRCISMYKLI